jgi:O-succinylbenzoate synthase
MKLKASFRKHTLQFRFHAGTSRGVLHTKDTWFLKIWDENNPSVFGLGEAGPLKALSIDDRDDFELKLEKVCKDISMFNDVDFSIVDVRPLMPLKEFPSIIFALETALLDLYYGGQRKIIDSYFFRGEKAIPINGLIWMGSKEFMQKQLEEKIASGYNCIKMKIGAIDFDTEISILNAVREKYNEQQITLRVDANGAFLPEEAMRKIQKLSDFHLHSIEQPIKAGQPEVMKDLCAQTPLPIALDEELIGIFGKEEKKALLERIKPQYIILKPTLLGGMHACREWIEIAEAKQVGWWITSALESNIGLNAISQFTSSYTVHTPQGLGTGQLYQNNIATPLIIRSGALWYDHSLSWGEV